MRRAVICLQLWITLNSQSSSLVFLGIRDGGHQERREGKSEELERDLIILRFHLIVLLQFVSENTLVK